MPAQVPAAAACQVDADVIVVGGGFGGCVALHQLRNQGYTVKLIEAGSDFGGVWHFNRYPGARPAGSLRSFNFRERFPGHVEIRQYFSQMVDVLDLRKDAIFNARVIDSRFDPESNSWTLRTEIGLTTKSRHVIFATGSTNKPYIPDFPGLDTFSGRVIHPAAWPKDIDLKGKKIGIVGQGASGLQILQGLKEDCQLTVFIRTPVTALPMRQRTLSHDESEQLKNLYEAYFRQAKYHNEGAYAYSVPQISFHNTTPEQRRQRYEELWARGTFAILLSSYPEYGSDKTANAEIYQFWAEKVRSRITDPQKRDIMAPLDQYQWIGTKRPSLETDYYEMIDKPNVKLVSLKKSPIKQFVRNGIVTVQQGEEETHDLDYVIVATGYDSVTGSLYEMNISDENGTMLQDKWKNGIHTYLGMMVPEVPNAFLLYGPQAPSGLSNGPPFLELQVEWIVEFLKRLEKEHATAVVVSSEAALDYRQKNMDVYNRSLLKETPSWWNGSNIPGKNKEPLFWVGGLQYWRKECQKGLEDWSRYMLRRK